ncbi:MAG: sigma-70 family RNA polymerase sigma factor [Armatimonadota bacterium]|nr:sigma-70 family RNA polymerase sigma factor [Armatimonadota bacterium]
MDIPRAETTTETGRRAGDLAQFTELLTRHWDSAYRYAYHLAGNASDAQDLVQQAAEEALRAYRRFIPNTHFDRWLLRIIHNSYIDKVRRERRRPMFSLDEVGTGLTDTDQTHDPEAAAESRLSGPALRALMALPPEFRAPVILVDLEGFSYDGAAQVLHCPVGTVRSRLHRGRLALREWLRPHLDALRSGDG